MLPAVIAFMHSTSFINRQLSEWLQNIYNVQWLWWAHRALYGGEKDRSVGHKYKGIGQPIRLPYLAFEAFAVL
jgi:hypothetical protein